MGLSAISWPELMEVPIAIYAWSLWRPRDQTMWFGGIRSRTESEPYLQWPEIRRFSMSSASQLHSSMSSFRATTVFSKDPNSTKAHGPGG